VFWRVAHPFSEFVELHREILHDSKHLSKEAKEHLPSFPQAETKPVGGLCSFLIRGFFHEKRPKTH